MNEKYIEIYEELKEKNPCIFCVQSLWGKKTDYCTTSKCNNYSQYYEKTKSEILNYVHPIYVEKLEKENRLLKKECERLRQKYEDDLR